MRRLMNIFSSTEQLLATDFKLPQTTDMNEAKAVTAEYTRQLEEARQKLLQKARQDYEEAMKTAEALMEAARKGEISMDEAERFMAATKAAGERLFRMANQDVQQRLIEVQTAVEQAVEFALRLAQLTDWMQESESLGEIGETADLQITSLNFDLSGLSPDEAIEKLKIHFTSIEEHEKALLEAEARLAEIKASGVQNIDEVYLDEVLDILLMLAVFIDNLYEIDVLVQLNENRKWLWTVKLLFPLPPFSMQIINLLAVSELSLELEPLTVTL
ncbi:unnamed protein product [Protopolystoma xenopodis]|uniref:Uncharacterized protein n=1 Tax=Protopolystoma xenopodis TaxID=117903 RepID=A0A3S5B5M9_9PLAT|nr:unnamed protein product [Protopolystoma xenopodis]